MSPAASSRTRPRSGTDRSAQMSRIRGADTRPEITLRKALWAAGLRYRLHARTPHGRPDVVFPGPRVAVFIDGCFWHGCPTHYVRPRSRVDFWSAKLTDNTERDRRQTLALEASGWRVIRLWEHEVDENLPARLAEIQAAVRGEPSAQPGQHMRVIRVEEVSPEGPDGRPVERRFMDDLRDPALTEDIIGPRVTAKWKRPDYGKRSK